MNYGETAQQVLEALQAAAGDDGDPTTTLTRTYPAPRGGGATPAPVVTPGVGLVFDYDFKDSGAGMLGATQILAGDKRLLLATLTATGAAIPAPLKGDKALAPDGLTYTVENVKVVSPSGVAVLYDVQLRR